MSLETSVPNTIENNCFASSCNNSFPKFTLSTPNSFSFFSTFNVEPKPEPANPEAKPVLTASIHFSAAVAMSSRCKRQDDSSGETTGAPAGVSLGLLRLGSGGECYILILRVILRSSSSGSAIETLRSEFKESSKQNQLVVQIRALISDKFKIIAYL